MTEQFTNHGPMTWPCFQFGPNFIRHFISSHNVNLPPFRMTERSIELALADLYLQHYTRDSVVEVGATSPYYWPHRIATVVDPTDNHPLVTIRESFLDFDIAGRPVLSISTFEHIGLPDYGLASDTAMQETAFNKLLQTAGDFLVTIPGGYNPSLDQLTVRLAGEGAFTLYAWSRAQVGNEWLPVALRDMDVNKLAYGPFWANTLLVMHRGRAFA